MSHATLQPNLFKRGLIEGKRQPGLWLTLESLNATEILAGAGYSWLLLDMEHTPVDPSQVSQHLRAAKGGTAEVVVRIPWNEPIMMKRLLDAGVRSFMVPFVQNAEEARAAVAATRYPPHGIRGVSGNMRGNNYARIKDYNERYHEEQCIIVQIETPAAAVAIPEIGAVEGVDGIFVGPNDLAANMGLFGKPGAPEVRAEIDRALDAIKKTGRAPGILNFNVGEARELFDAGYSYIAVGSDTAILARRSEALLGEINAA
ncbi:HpcH/HpaI aldolase family protein [Bosea sp. NBC_00550]|uniref:HpcH/HpaI aldolase family protein n=1 Tax=Bosea sp. NBC_00550 TaxID=2969621 RepID=UPI0022324DAC|nr:aldolase/citrate lyase family protein [Bosea sp. NBC_00550]UZF95884.1 aldolase/citrate lyase family protein [Bosea sp. NBC_00550]